MNLRCKVFRGAEAGALEEEINRFLAEELPRLGPARFEEITQSESASGVTLVIWYSLDETTDEILDDEPELERYEDVDGKELS
jgi:hypothetical protein